MKRTIALLLCICMVLSMAACGKPQMQSQNNALTEAGQMSRQDKELVAELVGGVDASDMTDAELDALIDQLIGSKDTTGQVVNLSNTQKTEEPSVDVTQNPGVYDENGAMTKPFDQVYPELIEKEQVKFSGESILVKLASDTLTDGLKAAGVGALEQIVPMEKASWYEAKLTEGTDAKAALAAVRELKEVLLAEFNYEIQTAALDDYKHFDKDKDEDFKKNGHNKDQWHFHHCGIPDGYEEMEQAGGDPSVIVAVIDSGVDYTHEDLKDNMWVNTKEIPDNNRDDDDNGYVDDYYGIDLVAGKGSGNDTNGHGTHVAGIIAARNNNVGTLGIAYNVKIMSVKAAAHNGTLNQANIAKAVLYACQNGAEVINMSFGGTACSIAVQDALEQAYTQCVLVASAGNNGAPNEGMFAIPNYPAALTYVLGVMSVDETGRESVFSNYDVFAFNGVEYELYAPGENIMSTLPGNKYGYLSGTSMAAPMVSSFAAILRSEFADRSKYPTKFIYGQLAATSQIQADCLDPELHGLHNLPQVVDLNAALTNMPKPEVGLQDYYLFDSPEFSEKNNGDGVIDAGETIALGLTLRNRWGMSENTLVTIDTIASNSGLSDPYFTIVNPTVNYGSVGTYSTKDAGKLYTDELFTGWENPFMIQVAEDCPNDYRFTLNVTVTCENALDEADETVYTTSGSVNEAVRAGYILPSIIEEDMVLTKNNLYIIPNATIITEGTTVRVEPGTHIQFWSDDADDPYADNYIAYLLVNGKLLVEGTKEEPVYIYPSQLMDHYNVEIGSSRKGFVSLKYADITNLYVCDNNTETSNHIDEADHCTFRVNYGTYVYYRYLSEGVVEDSYTNGCWIGNINAKDSVFYRIGTYSNVYLSGNFDRCIFTHSGIDYNNSGTYKNCVFLGNSFVDQTNPDNIVNSSYRADVVSLPDETDVQNNCLKISYRPETGTTYVRWDSNSQAFAEYLKQMYGGGFVKVETVEERLWLSDKYTYRVNVQWDHAQNCLVWNDGTPVSPEVFPSVDKYDGSYSAYVSGNSLVFTDGYYGDTLYEIPGQILPTDISFREYAVDMDLEATYQMAPLNTPVQLDMADFRYESSDERIVTVSDTGLVTPVGTGTADVWVWSLDKAIRNRVTFTVREYVALEGLTLTAPVTELAVGEKIALSCALTPENTTRKNVTYTTSDPSLATVDAGGILTGKGSGKVTVTAACEGFTDSVELTVYVKATELNLSRAGMVADLADGTMDLPEVLSNAGAEMLLSWRSTDESVAAIEEGKLALKALGTTSIVVTDSRSGLSAACLVIVQEGKTAAVEQMYINNCKYAALLEDGSLYFWSNSSSAETPRLIRENVTAIGGYDGYLLVALADGIVEQWDIYNSGYCQNTYSFFQGKKIVGVEYYNERYFVITDNGMIYAWGDNAYGSLGVGFTDDVDTPIPLDLEGVVQVNAYGEHTWFHTKSGNLYHAGYTGEGGNLNPRLVSGNVEKLMSSNDSAAYCFMTDGSLQKIYASSAERYIFDLENPEDMASGSDVSYQFNNGHNSGSANAPGVVLLKNGKVYRAAYNGQYQDGTRRFITEQVPGITNAKRIFSDGQTHYVSTEDGMLLAFGETSSNQTAGATAANKVTNPVAVALLGIAKESMVLTGDNLAEGVLTQDALELRFNKALVSAAPKLYMDGVQVAMSYIVTDTNALTVTRNSGFVPGVHYQLALPVGTVHGAMGVVNDKDIVIDFAFEQGQDTPDMPDTELPEAQEKVFYKTIVDSSVERILTPASLVEKVETHKQKTQLNPNFTGNAILNPISTDFEPSHWLRIQAPTVNVGEYRELPMGGNWWGSVNDRAIGLQMIDFTDFPNYYRLMYAPFLTEAPENTFPFVTSVKLFNAEGEEVTTVGNEKVLFQVKFNRDMDTSIPLQVRFGSAYPYGDYEIAGQYVDARTWEGEYTLNTLIENGNQFFTISNGCSATDDLALQLDRGRFTFEIDTTAAQALIMQGAATSTGIELKWTQDDFKTLMGYNVYRSTAEDGLYTRLNSTVIPADTMQWFDTTVEPGVIYYYNFTVVQTDLTESEPSGKIVIMSKDTMAPNIYHSPAGSAFTGSNLVISATITDNLNIAYANLYYRVAGTQEWITIRMNKLNDKYSAIIPASYMTTAGVEYYIEAFDGISFTYNASAEAPYTVAVQQAIEANALGDVDGDGVITNLDALLLLYAINDKYNLSTEEFARADLNSDGVLWAAEALRILQYVSGAEGSLKM